MRKSIWILALLLLFFMVGCANQSRDNQSYADESISEFELTNIRNVFSEHIGEELEGTPKSCDPWAGGKRYKTDWYFDGNFLIYMNIDGYVNSVVWVGDGDRTSLYNRSDDMNAPPIVAPNDGNIHLIDGQIGEYGAVADSGYIHYKVPSGKYTVVNEVYSSTVFVVGDSDPNDGRDTVRLKEYGEEATIVVDDDTHIELSSSAQVALIEATE